jgi:tRNA threonylcarbamoyladenosine biosynthesis protein TsaE
MWAVASGSVEQTFELGARLGAVVQPGAVIALLGELGAGKTAFAKGVGAGLGVAGVVQSPTYVVVQSHEGGRLPLFHADLYRVEGARELDQIGLDELIEAGGVVLIEWAELHPDVLPADHLVVRLHHVPDGRLVELSATGPAHARLLERARG